MEASWRVPVLLKWAAVSVISVLLASRVSVPSGSPIAPRPVASDLTESPAWTRVPVVAAAYAAPVWATDTIGLKTVRVAAALGAAWAAEVSQKKAPPTIRTRTTRTIRKRIPARPRLGTPAATADMLTAKDT